MNSRQFPFHRDAFRRASLLALALVYAAAAARTAEAADDVLLQTVNGKIAIGIVNDGTFAGTLGHRVFRGHFQSNARSADPGFVSFATGSANMPPGAAGFPSNRDVSFDLLPMTIGPEASNFWYWDGSDLNGNGLDVADVQFARPAGIAWDVYDANFSVFSATGSDQPVAGGLIQRTSADIDPNDGVDTGSIHKHLVLQLRNAGSPGTAPPAGVYVTAWQSRSAGFETSDPFFFVHRTFTVANSVRDLAAEWIQANLEMLASPPGMPGDFNSDQRVDAADFVLWRKSFGDAERYAQWKAQFGTVEAGAASAQSAAVPEPANWLMAMIGVTACGGLLKRRRAFATGR